MKVKCEYAKSCYKHECNHINTHDLINDCDNFCECKKMKTRCVPIIQKLTTKWTKNETKYLQLIVRNCMSYYHIYKYKHFRLLTWQQISDIVSKKFNTNRTAESCRSKFIKG